MGEEKNKVETYSTFKKWVIAARCFALPASVTPYTFGSLLAWAHGPSEFSVGLFALGLLGLVAIHTASNMINDIADFEKGIDLEPNAGSGAVVRRILSKSAVARAAAMLLFLGVLIGLYLAIAVSINILYIGLAGVLAGILYSKGPFPLKYNGLGDLTVFVAFGLLGSLGGWMLQTASLSWIPVVMATPVSIFIIAILHANNWRDITSDMNAGVKTVAGMLGQWSLPYYKSLIIAPYVLVTALVATDILIDNSVFSMHPIYLICWVSLPKAVSLLRTANMTEEGAGMDSIRDLDASTAQLNLVFGLLCILSAILEIAFFS